MLSFEKMQSNESFQSKGLTVILHMNEVWVCSHTKQDAFSKKFTQRFLETEFICAIESNIYKNLISLLTQIHRDTIKHLKCLLLSWDRADKTTGTQ